MIADSLREIVGDGNVLEGEPLSKHTTFKIGGPAAVMVLPKTVDQVSAVAKACNEQGVGLRVIGLGSNILASDSGVEGVVMKLADNFDFVSIDGTCVICQAGASNKQVADAALEAGLGGYEFASGIPGSIGGAAIMNAGAYDGMFSDVALSVQCVSSEGEVVALSAQQADWGYRHSLMMEKGWIVVGAILELLPKDKAEIRALMDDLQQRRESKQPLEMPSAGSTFKRPEGYFAGKLIQDAQLMGYTVGGAQVSTKHAGFVVNANEATAADVRQLISDVQSKVFANAGVRLEPEVRMWGFDD